MAAMEVRLDAIGGFTPPPDTFVAMRVGDVQKQSRFDQTRTYRFPDPGDSRGAFGRIEVFKRIGSMTVNLDKSNQECEVPCQYPELNSWGLKVKLNVKSNEKWERPATREKKSKARQRMDDAQSYISKHKLEELLAEAMREVIRNKPENPHKFLSGYIMDNAEQGFLPVIRDAKRATAPEPSPKLSSRSKSAARQFIAEPPPPLPQQPPRGEKLPPIQSREMKHLPPSRSEPVLSEMRAQLRNALAVESTQGAPQALKAVTLAPMPETLAPAKTAAVQQSSKIAVSPPAYLLPANYQAIDPGPSAPPQAILPMKSYYVTNFSGSVAESVCSKLFPKASRSDANLLRTQVRGVLVEAARNGTIERALSSVKFSQASEEAAAPAAMPAVSPPVYLLPASSQAQVLCKGPPAIAPINNIGEYCRANFKGAKDSTSSVLSLFPSKASSVQELPREKPNFKRLPSVCTWVALRPVNTLALPKAPEVSEPPFRHRASVGTWLTRKPDTVARPWYFQERDAGEHSEYIHKLQDVIAEKDLELEKLKAQLAALQEQGPALENLAPASSAKVVNTAARSALAVAPFRAYYTQHFKPWKGAEVICNAFFKPRVVVSQTSSNKAAIAQGLTNAALAIAPVNPGAAAGLSAAATCLTAAETAKSSSSQAAAPAAMPAVSPPVYLLPAISQAQVLCKGPPATAPITNFGEYCRTNFKGATESTSAVLSLFPSKASKAPAKATFQAKFGQQPSVCTWIGHRFARGMRQEAPAKVEFVHLPSVSTWIGHRFEREIRQSAQASEKKPDVVLSPPGHWMQKSSVGTWLAHRWVEPVKQPSLLERSRTSLLRMPQEDLIACMKEELEAKDRKIEELKQNNPS